MVMEDIEQEALLTFHTHRSFGGDTLTTQHSTSFGPGRLFSQPSEQYWPLFAQFTMEKEADGQPR